MGAKKETRSNKPEEQIEGAKSVIRIYMYPSLTPFSGNWYLLNLFVAILGSLKLVCYSYHDIVMSMVVCPQF